MGVTIPPLRAADSSPGLLNWDPLLLPRTRKALANVRAGLGPCRISFIGHSEMIGYGAGTGDGSAGAWAKSVPATFAKLLTKKDMSLPTRRGSFWGNYYTPNAASASGYSAYDPRVSMSTNWNFTNVAYGIGGNLFSNTTDSGLLTFTPEETIDTAALYLAHGPGGGNVSWNFDGGSNTNVSTNGGSNTFPTPTVVTAGTLASHTLNVARQSVGCYLVGVETYNSALPDVRVRNWGEVGSTTSTWLTGIGGNPWAGIAGAVAVGGDLTFICLGDVDQNDGVSASTFVSNMQTIISDLQAVSDVILMRDHWPSKTAQNVSNDSAFNAAIRSLALEFNVPMVDVKERFDTYENANQYGWYYSDAIHFNQIGQAMEAAWLAGLVATL
jgi:hypothetical protein